LAGVGTGRERGEAAGYQQSQHLGQLLTRARSALRRWRKPIHEHFPAPYYYY